MSLQFEFEFCGTVQERKDPSCRRPGKCCPTVSVEGESVQLGGAEEGVTRWSREQFADFVLAAREGKFDSAVADILGNS